MPSKDTSTIETRLTKTDLERFRNKAKQQGKTHAQLLRDITLGYLNQAEATTESDKEAARLAERDKIIAAGLKSIENRFATLLVRLGIDLEAMYVLLWTTAKDNPDRQALFDKCYEVGSGRFRRKLKGLEVKMKESLKHQGDQLQDHS